MTKSKAAEIERHVEKSELQQGHGFLAVISEIRMALMMMVTSGILSNYFVESKMVW